jgi:serine/threonine protein kinase
VDRNVTLSTLRELAFYHIVSPHPHITQCLEMAVDNQGSSWFILQRQYTTLWHCLHPELPQVRPPWKSLFVLWVQILSAVNWMHFHGMMHRDIKPDNVLVNQDCSHAWLTDFGSTVPFRCNDENKDGWTTQTNHENYRPPELLASKTLKTKFGPEVDVWSLGVVLWYCIHKPNVTPCKQLCFDVGDSGLPSKVLRQTLAEVPSQRWSCNTLLNYCSDLLNL